MKTLKYPVNINSKNRVDFGDQIETDTTFLLLPHKDREVIEFSSEAKAQVELWYREANKSYKIPATIANSVISFVFERDWINKWDKVDATITVADGDEICNVGTISFSINLGNSDWVIDDFVHPLEENYETVSETLKGIAKEVIDVQNKVAAEFRFGEPKKEWYIYHKQNKYPDVFVLSEDNHVLVGEVYYHGRDAITIFFNEAVSGTAILN
ncbi:TPA: hypothetical protein ACGO1T_000558 [Streptococcus suis]